MTIGLDDFLGLRKHLPAVDVRSPDEFDHGHIPAVHNIPILNNEERKAVGTTYKHQGKNAAIKVGFKIGTIDHGVHCILFIGVIHLKIVF